MKKGFVYSKPELRQRPCSYFFFSDHYLVFGRKLPLVSFMVFSVFQTLFSVVETLKFKADFQDSCVDLRNSFKKMTEFNFLNNF